jgi:hypothetical protein
MVRQCRCGNTISAERLEVLPNTYVCVACSREKPYIGAMVYDHKTAGRLVYVKPENGEAVETLRRFVNRARR